MSELDLDEACLGNNMPKFILLMIKVRSRLDSIWVLMKDIGAGVL